MKKAILVLALLSSTWSFVSAQQALDSSGGSMQVGSNLIIDYSVGETVTVTTGTPANINNFFTAGVIQPYPFVVVGLNDRFDELYSLQVFPNPVGKILTIETDYRNFQGFRFTNMLGQPVADGSFDYTPLDLSWMAAGTYFLTLSSTKDSIIKTIKIIKQ